jgi:glycerophosphoryl diester phosphodiesterase
MAVRRRERRDLLAGALASVALGAVPGSGDASAGRPSNRSTFDVQGHRGARGLAPENTIVGCETALAIGVSTLELDLGMSRDRVLVVHHDRTLNPDVTRRQDGRWLEARGPALLTLRFDELQAYDVGRLRPGSRYAEAFPQQRPVDGQPIPSLEQVFARVAALGADRIGFNLETKLSPLAPSEAPEPREFAETLVGLLARHGLTERCTVQSFDWRTLREAQRLRPALRTVYLSAEQSGFDTIRAADSEPSPWTAGRRVASHGSVPAAVADAGGAAWSPHWADLDPARIEQSHRLGLPVIPWTVNDPAAMRRLIGWGVDGLITDRPDLARDAMREAGLPLPAPIAIGR